jgi:hypothetical protein
MKNQARPRLDRSVTFETDADWSWHTYVYMHSLSASIYIIQRHSTKYHKIISAKFLVGNRTKKKESNFNKPFYLLPLLHLTRHISMNLCLLPLLASVCLSKINSNINKPKNGIPPVCRTVYCYTEIDRASRHYRAKIPAYTSFFLCLHGWRFTLPGKINSAQPRT